MIYKCNIPRDPILDSESTSFYYIKDILVEKTGARDMGPWEVQVRVVDPRAPYGELFWVYEHELAFARPCPMEVKDGT
jgi:hypothetical protein